MEKKVQATVYRDATQEVNLSSKLTTEEERSKALRESPDFLRIQKLVEREIKSLTYAQPNLNDSQRLQLAARIVLAKEPKPTQKTTSSDYIQETGK